jgi:serine/threonine protein phosphatase PrpC
MIIELHAKSDVGRVRRQNEDNSLVLDLHTGKHWTVNDSAESPANLQQNNIGEQGFVMVVSDGMGGALAGDVASRMAVETVRDMLLGADPNITLSPDPDLPLADKLRIATVRANAEIHRRGQDPKYTGMGATFTGASISKNDLLSFVQVGDSRAYLIRGDQIKLVTKDQSLVQQLVDVQQISEEEAETHMFRNVILQALGAQSDLSPVGSRVSVRRGDILLLCSDGLSGKLRADDMLRIVTENSKDLDAASSALIAEANERGGEDNITVVLARFDGAELLEPGSDPITVEASPVSEDTTLGDTESA